MEEIATDFGRRLLAAIRAEKTTQTAVGRALNLPGARMPRLLGKGKNPILSPGPDIILLLADHLRVSYEWLAIGRGPMRREGWAPSELEEAMNFAAKHGARADAIAAVTERLRDADRMSVLDWVTAFDTEARRLDRLNVPRPEVVAKRQAQFRRVGAKKRRAHAKDAALAAERAQSRTRRGA